MKISNPYWPVDLLFWIGVVVVGGSILAVYAGIVLTLTGVWPV